jgi:hypothetical protein
MTGVGSARGGIAAGPAGRLTRAARNDSWEGAGLPRFEALDEPTRAACGKTTTGS